MTEIGKKCIKLYNLNLYFNLKGEFKNCCYQKKKYYQKFISTKEASENEFINEVREYMEEGKEHPSCRHCYDIEAMGIKSPRNMYNDLYESQHNNIFPLEYSHSPKSLYFRFSNVCNFACRMCSTYSSTGRKKLDMHLYNTDTGIVEFPHRVFTQLKNVKFLSQLNEIDIKGGEPFLHKQHFDFLHYLVKNNLSKNIRLKYNTNLSILPGVDGQSSNLLPSQYKSILELWDNFSFVTLRVSVEGYGKENDYIRIGADWDTIEKNIDVIKRQKNIRIGLTSTIQIDNLLFLPRLVLFAQEKGISLNISSHSFVYEPGHYNIKILPNTVKKYVEKFYNICKEKYNILDAYRENMDDIIMYMYSGETNTELLKEYIRCTKITDELYGIGGNNKIYNLIVKK